MNWKWFQGRSIARYLLGSGTLSVFSTPSMIASMERASMLCVSELLEEGETTVGGLVEVKHLKAYRNRQDCGRYQ